MAWSDRVTARSGEGVDPAVLFEPGTVGVFCDVLRQGALVSFGMSRDGGSMSCTVTFDGAWDREWFREPQPLHDWLAAAHAAIEDEPPKTGQRSSNGAPRRGR